MQDVLERPDITLTEDPMEWHPVACEGPTHPIGKWGHVPADPAAFLVVYPCGLSLLMCGGWVAQRLTDPPERLCLCAPACGGTHLTSDLRYIPLD